ncbi:MAG TPA: hypothetical protein VKX28_17655 [Xanthobacteraceae bacterium]|jgi:hypothetical protein|nr:hypothetical protein [Xanthobacteraceae bacterium]
MRIPGILASLIAASSLVGMPAVAFDTSKLGYGSLFLGDITDLVNSSPKLRQEVEAALKAANRKADAELCESPRFPGPWHNLHGEHVAPFVCQIGGKWLKIDASVRVTGPKGEVFETETAQAMKRATKISQTNVTWAWTADDPRKAR